MWSSIVSENNATIFRKRVIYPKIDLFGFVSVGVLLAAYRQTHKFMYLSIVIQSTYTPISEQLCIPPTSRSSRFLFIVRMLFTVRSSYASAVLGIIILSVSPSVRPSICLPVTRVLCDETKEHTADILITHERVITLVFWHEQRSAGDIPFLWTLRLKWSNPFEKRQLWPISAYNVWTVRAIENRSIIANKKSTTRVSKSYRWSAYITPNSPEGRPKKRICHFSE